MAGIFGVTAVVWYYPDSGYTDLYFGIITAVMLLAMWFFILRKKTA